MHVLRVHPIFLASLILSSHSPVLAPAILINRELTTSVSYMKDQRVAVDRGGDCCAGARGIAPFAGIDPLIYVGGEP